MASTKNFAIIEIATKNLLPVQMEYRKPGEPAGRRVLNPHVLHVLKKRDGSEAMFLEGIQTAGVSRSGLDGESWRRFSFRFVHGLALLPGADPFTVSAKYNPDAYPDAVARIERPRLALVGGATRG